MHREHYVHYTLITLHTLCTENITRTIHWGHSSHYTLRTLHTLCTENITHTIHWGHSAHYTLRKLHALRTSYTLHTHREHEAHCTLRTLYIQYTEQSTHYAFENSVFWSCSAEGRLRENCSSLCYTYSTIWLLKDWYHAKAIAIMMIFFPKEAVWLTSLRKETPPRPPKKSKH